ncbi:MAG: carboxypeptidase-like regulatory domain-containing protein, partial [Planctomycetota bacterium]
ATQPRLPAALIRDRGPRRDANRGRCGDRRNQAVSRHRRQPVHGANVYFRRGDEYRGGSTQSNGAYAAVALLPGEWLLTGRADGFASYEQRVTLDERSYQQFDLELRPAYVVKVKIQNAAGEFVPDLIRQKAWTEELGAVATAAPLPGDLPIAEQTSYLRFGVGEWRTNSGLV